ncbi:MAG: hypothetical protein ACTSUO_09935 [Candidatus Thorarchaeota archaeon]
MPREKCENQRLDLILDLIVFKIARKVKTDFEGDIWILALYREQLGRAESMNSRCTLEGLDL